MPPEKIELQKNDHIDLTAKKFVDSFSPNGLSVLVQVGKAADNVWVRGGNFFEKTTTEIVEQSQKKLTESDRKLLTYGFLRRLKGLLSRDNADGLVMLSEMAEKLDILDSKKDLLTVALTPFFEDKSLKESVEHVLSVIQF